MCLQAHLWACGRGDVSTPSFGSYLNPISTSRQIMPTLYYIVSMPSFKATGGPGLV